MEYRIQMQDVQKSFGGIHALKGVTFNVRPGEIHALVGENGAGKSTLMKILAGAYQMDKGSVVIDGQGVRIDSPKRGKELGIGIVYQEFELAPHLTVAENIFLDRLSGPGGIVRWKYIINESRRIIESLGFDIRPEATVEDLTVASQQIVEIAKALAFNAHILILDEPTAVLTDNESEKLFDTLYRLKEQGVSIIYISHRMEEIFRISDTITTLRDGMITGSMPREEASLDQVIELMIGGKLAAMFPERESTIGGEVLRVEGLSGPPNFHDISFSVRRGEVVGIAGLVGSGRTEVLRAIFGGDGRKKGRVFLNDSLIHVKSPRDGVKCGISLVPENRKEQGLVIDKMVKENATMANLKTILGPLNWILQPKEDALAGELCEKLTVKTKSINSPVGSLSGGNQQKVVLAKWFNTDSDVILLDEPTRGVDVGAKVEIYKLINEFSQKGMGVVFVSSETPELIGMCDRVLVMAKGRIQGELLREELSEANILKLAVGGGEA